MKTIADYYKELWNNCIINDTINAWKKYAVPIRRVIAVSGAAALGKSYFCSGLKAYLENRGVHTLHIELDGFLKDRYSRNLERLSGYDPCATNLPLLLNSLENLILKGQKVSWPVYRHENGTHDTPIVVEPQEVILLDGIMSLHYEVRSRFPNYTIFIISDNLTMRGLRLQVDMIERGYDVFQALAHADNEVKMYDRWIHHQIEFANVIIRINRNRDVTS